MRRDDGEGAEVGLPHVLRQRVGVLLKVSQQRRRAALRLLDHLPVEPRVRRQDGAAHAHHILPGKQPEERVTGGRRRERTAKCEEPPAALPQEAEESRQERAASSSTTEERRRRRPEEGKYNYRKENLLFLYRRGIIKSTIEA